MPRFAPARALKAITGLTVLFLCAEGASAADVEVYGAIELDFTYTHTNHRAKADVFEMSQNMYAGSLFGFRGTEKQGEIPTVVFILENGFVPDTGAYYDSTAIFDRESQLYLEGSWGDWALGASGRFPRVPRP